LNPPLLVVVAAVLTTQPSIYLSFRQLIDQLQGNTIGAVLAVASVRALGNEPIVIGLTVMVVIMINLFLKLESTIVLSVVTVMAVMGQPDSAVERFLLVMIGILLAILVNAAFLPPNPERQLREQMDALHKRVLFLLRNGADQAFSAKSFGDEKAKLAKELTRAEELYRTFKEERTFMRKQRRRKAEKLVVYRHMLQVVRHEMEVISVVRRSTGDGAAKQVMQVLNALTHYHESILMKFDGKVKPKLPADKRSRAAEELDALAASLRMEWTAGTSPEALRLLDALCVEWARRLHRLDALVSGYAARMARQQSRVRRAGR
jgi:uncharacterized membrane protein YgaE (UPF0421/DUF939 family)